MITIPVTVLKMRIVPITGLMALALGGITLAACGSDSSVSATGPRVVVTTSILGDVVEHLVGEAVAVEVIMPAGADPHDAAPSPKQVEMMRNADLLVINGEGFEAGLADTIAVAEADGVEVVRATDAIDRRGWEEDGAEVPDPHVFTSPANMVVIAGVIADRLVTEFPSLDTPRYRATVAAYLAELRALDASVEQTLAGIAEQDRILITNHDVFGYFADRYNFEILGAVIPSGSTLAEPSSQELVDLADLMVEADIRAIFADSSSPARLADALASEGIDVEVVELFSESLGEPGSGADTYVGMVRTNANRIAAALD